MVNLLKIKPYRQRTSGLCGPASLKMVLAYYGVKKSEHELARLSRATCDRGVEAPGLARVARGLGFKARVKDNATLGDIKKLVVGKRIPVIVDWFSGDDGHYSVVVGITARAIYLQDPEPGKLKVVDTRTFKRVWFDFPGDVLRSKHSLIIRRMIVVYR